MQKINGNGKKRGRPRKSIDYGLVWRLALIQCTQDEISGALGISTVTLQKDEEFLSLHKKGMGEGRKSLRRIQWEKAVGREGIPATDQSGNIMVSEKGAIQWLTEPLKPNTTMQIWLGKQYLEQRDHQEISGPGGGPIEHKEVYDFDHLTDEDLKRAVDEAERQLQH